MGLAIYFIAAYVRSTRAFAQSLPDDDPRCAAFLQAHPTRRHVQIRVSSRIASPLSYGLLHPVILLPKGMNRDGLPFVLRILAMKNVKKNTPLTRLVAGSLVAAACFAMISAVPACADDKVFIVKAEDTLVMPEGSLVLSADTAEDSAYSYAVYDKEPSASESDALPIEWWTVDEFESYMAQTRKDLEELVQNGERGYTSTDGWFTWTQEKVEETMAVYEEMLDELKRGVKISKPFGEDGEGADIIISKGPDSVSTHNDSTLMIDADTNLYVEKDGGAVFHATPDCAAISESARDALEAFSAERLEQSPYSLLSACPVCFETKSASESGEDK